jgi:di/tricarboxylate transporter
MPQVEPQLLVLLILLGSLLLFVTDALRYDLVALLVVLALVLTRCLTPEEAFAGFASEPVIVVACLFLFGQAISRWGVGEILTERVLGGGGGGEGWLVLRIVLVSAVLAAVMSDVAVVGILIPLVGVLARQRGVPASRLLLSVSFGAFLGDLLLLIASAKNLAVNGVIEQYRGLDGTPGTPFGMFDYTGYGFVLLLLGAAYLAGPGRALFPPATPAQTLTERFRVPKFVTEVLVEPSSTLVNRAVADLDALHRSGVTVLGIVRAGDEVTILAPGPYNRIRPDDTLILQGEPEALLRLRQELGLRERAGVGAGDRRLDSADVKLVEAVIPAGSELVGRTLAEASFRAQTGLNVLALSRHGAVQASKLANVRLAVGDSLLIQGHLRDVERARAERQVVVLGELSRPLAGRGALVSVLLLAGVLALSLTKLVPLHVAALAGAVGLVLFGCLSPKGLYRNVDWVVIVLIGGMLALGRAFDKHGLAETVAGWIGALGLETPRVTLALLMVVAMLLAQTTTSIATAVILAPVAMSLAEHMGLSDRAFLMGVLTGANCTFLSPVSHPANAMIVGPGDYRFRDFLRLGLPLSALFLVAGWALIPMFWPFEGR